MIIYDSCNFHDSFGEQDDLVSSYDLIGQWCNYKRGSPPQGCRGYPAAHPAAIPNIVVISVSLRSRCLHFSIKGQCMI